MMEFTGLFHKYPCNRPLTEQERAHQLKQNVRLNLHPHYQLSVIVMNSTYLESVDKWFAWKGIISLAASVLLVLFVGFFGGMAVSSLLEASGVIESTEPNLQFLLLNGLAAATVGSLLAWGLIWMLRKDSFAYTHYPIRFNRKTRMVHVFQTDGKTISAPWDEIFFTLGGMGREWEVRGHILDVDRTTVRATFALSYVSPLSDHDVDPATTQFSNEDFVRGHWEFIRRYMEEGLQAVGGQVEFCMPLDGRRETAKGGAQRLFANFSGGSLPLLIIMFPFCAITSLFRAFAMRTSKIPQWPKEIEEECTIEQNDPYAIKGDAAGNRIAVYPEAARAAGVQFVAPPPGTAT